ncbi:hypothetical protein Vafri_1967 [Volvox africanus]|nr:hypothetical protein Vafri_1967 [Volvox africanus]
MPPPPPPRGLTPPPAAATTVSPPQAACSNGASSGACVSKGQLPSVCLPCPLIAAGTSNLGTLAAAPATGSCASSIGSYTSGMTTTSRPSRWGMLAGVLSAGLRSLSQLTNIMEPETGNLSREVVYDLTSRASQLDAVRAAGQVSDMSLVGSGSMGLVYRGRISDGGVVGGGGRTVCVKHLVTRGADGMAAPATEGLLSRALAHPNVIRTLSWHVTRVAPENFLQLPEALAAMAYREQYRKGRLLAKHGCRIGGTKVGKRRRSGDGGSFSNGGLCHIPAPSAAAAAPASGSKTQLSASAIPPPMVRGLMDNGGGRDGDSNSNGGGNHGGFGAVRAGSSLAAHNQGDGSAAAVAGLQVSPRIAPSLYAANILEMVRASERAGDGVDRTAQASPGTIPVTRIGVHRCAFGHNRSFTGSIAGTRVGTQLRKAATVAVVLRPSGTPPDGGFMKASIPTPALSPPSPPQPPLLPTNGRALQQLRQVLLERGPSQNTDFELSRSAPWAEDFYRSSDMTTYSILQQTATCDAAATAAPTAAVAAGTVGLSLRRSGSTTAWLFSRDSVSSHLLTPSPHSSNHTPEMGSLLYDANRGTAATPAGTAGDNTLILSSTVAPMSFGLYPVSSQPGSGGGYGGCSGIPGCRGRGILTHTASRLHFSTTPITQLSIPEHGQAVGLTEDASLCGSTGGGTQPSNAAPAGQPDSRRLLLTSSSGAGSVEAMGYGNLPSIGGGGRPLCVASLSPPPSAAPTVAAAAAVAESSMCSTCITAGGGAFTGGASSGTGHGPGKNADAGSMLGAFFMRSQRNLKQRSSLLSEQGQRGRKDTHSGRARTGLLAAALAASNLHSPGHNPGMSRCQTPCTVIGSSTSNLARPAAARSPQPQPPTPLLLLDLAAGPPTGNARQMRSGFGDGGDVSPSRISSAALTPSATTDSSVKHPSGTSKSSNLAQMLIAGAGGGGLGTVAGTSSAYDLTTPAGNGSGSKPVASGSTPDGVVHTGRGSSINDSGVVMEAAAATPRPPPARLLPEVTGEGSAVQQEALERGWRTLQQIMMRLNAKPGDFLTRIVMEDADQGSLLEALRHGVLGMVFERNPDAKRFGAQKPRHKQPNTLLMSLLFQFIDC